MRDIGIYNMNFLNSDDTRFVNTRKVFDAKMKSLVAKGVGTYVKQADPILLFHELKLCEGVFGNHNAESLQYTVFFYCCKIFGLRGVDEHSALQCEQFEIGSDERGTFIQFIGRQSKRTKEGFPIWTKLSNKTLRRYCIEGRIVFPYFYQIEVIERTSFQK